MERNLDKPSFVEDAKATAGESRELNLTEAEKKSAESFSDGLRQVENEARAFEGVVVPTEKGEKKTERKNKLKEAGIKAMLFITLMTSMGVFAEEAHGNGLGEIAGNAVERIFNGGYTLRESKKIRGAMINGYVGEIRMQQRARERSFRTQQRGFDNADKKTQESREDNYEMEVDRIMKDKTLNARQRAEALRGAESLLD